MRRTSTLATAALAFAIVALSADAAFATKTVRKVDPGDLQSMCEAGGGVFFPPNANGVYACLTKSGDLVSCGGTSNDCSINRKVGHLPPNATIQGVLGQSSTLTPLPKPSASH